MSPDDRRHGTHAGYLAGCRCQPCSDGHYRACKERELYRLRHGGSCRFDHDAQAALIEPWLAMGITLHAIVDAAGLTHRNDLIAQYRAGGPVNRATFAALAAVTEASFADGAKVHADLTHDRIYSLMAAGHRLCDMPIVYRGNWRDQTVVSVGTARAIRNHFNEHAHLMGTNKVTASRAQRAGHLTPYAWDDPGTLAWPGGIRKMPTRLTNSKRDTLAEYTHLTGLGESHEQACKQLGVAPESIEQALLRQGRKDAA